MSTDDDGQMTALQHMFVVNRTSRVGRYAARLVRMHGLQVIALKKKKKLNLEALTPEDIGFSSGKSTDERKKNDTILLGSEHLIHFFDCSPNMKTANKLQWGGARTMRHSNIGMFFTHLQAVHNLTFPPGIINLVGQITLYLTEGIPGLKAMGVPKKRRNWITKRFGVQ